MESLGLALLVTAAMLAVLGALMLFGGRMGMSSLPGNLRLQGRGWSCFVPIASSVILSLVLTLLLNLLLRRGR